MKTNAKERREWATFNDIKDVMLTTGDESQDECPYTIYAVQRLLADVDDAVRLLDAARDANTQAYHNPPCEECLGCRLRTFLKEPDA